MEIVKGAGIDEDVGDDFLVVAVGGVVEGDEFAGGFFLYFVVEVAGVGIRHLCYIIYISLVKFN